MINNVVGLTPETAATLKTGDVIEAVSLFPVIFPEEKVVVLVTKHDLAEKSLFVVLYFCSTLIGRGVIKYDNKTVTGVLEPIPC